MKKISVLLLTFTMLASLSAQTLGGMLKKRKKPFPAGFHRKKSETASKKL
jgi:hypothetical protein